MGKGSYSKISSDEMKYRAEDDARTIKNMAAINSDKSRHKAAMNVIHVEHKNLGGVIAAVKAPGKAPGKAPLKTAKEVKITKIKI